MVVMAVSVSASVVEVEVELEVELAMTVLRVINQVPSSPPNNNNNNKAFISPFLPLNKITIFNRNAITC